MTRVSAILLAAGLSKRMNGPNKLLLPFQNTSVVHETYQALSQSDVAEIIVVTGRDYKKVEAALSLRPEDTFVHNTDYEKGMTSSIQRGIECASGQAYMICLADMPWLRNSHYNELLQYYNRQRLDNDQAILTTKANGQPGNPVIFSAAHREAILSHTDPEGCRAVVKANQEHVLAYETTDTAYVRDIDTQEDYNQLKE